jgi:hypothetical protein
MTTVVIWPTGKTSYEITRKAGNEMRQVRTHTWAPDTSPKLKSLQDLSIRVNPEVIEEVVHHAGLWVNGGLHLCLLVCKVIHLSLKLSDPFHCVAHHRVFPNRWFGGWWEPLRLNQPSQVSSHHRHECEQTLDGGGTRTSPSPQRCGWRCRHRP